MRTIATLLNIALLLAVAFLVLEEGAPKGGYIWLFVLMVLAPLSALLALRFGGAQDWLSLVLQRKALEEKRKIDELARKQ